MERKSHDTPHDTIVSDDDDSIDTQEAVLEMLGLTSMSSCFNHDDDDTNTDNLTPTSKTLGTTTKTRDSNRSSYPPSDSNSDDKCSMRNRDQSEISTSQIPFPKRCSRHGYKDCFGIVLENVWSSEQCQYLMDLANRRGFQYIQEATHIAPDGSTYSVKIQHPNPHKLCAIDTDHHYHPLLSPSKSATATTQSYAMDPTQLLNHLYHVLSTCLLTHPSFDAFQRRTQCGPPMGLNPRIRILRYDAVDQDSFLPHFDAMTLVFEKEPIANDSRLTVDATAAPRDKNRMDLFPTQIPRKKKSLLTVLVYLNHGNGMDFDGGNTLYLNYSTDRSYSLDRNRKEMDRAENPLQQSSSSTSSPSPWSSISNHESLVQVTPKVGRVVVFEHDMFHSGEPLLWGTKYILRTDVLFMDDDEKDKSTPPMQESESRTEAVPHSLNATEMSKAWMMLDICKQLHLSDEYVNVLHDLGLLHCTCESFLSPGISVITSILEESGFDKKTITELISLVVRYVSS